MKLVLWILWSGVFHGYEGLEERRSENMRGRSKGYDVTVAIPTDYSRHLKEMDGVAATLFLGSPKWFQQRYSLMINQMKSALPSSWIIQIFYLPSSPMAQEAIQHPGIVKNIASGHVVITPIPSSLGTRIRRKDLLKMPWFWRNLLADRVLLFGGNAVLCSNSPYTLSDFVQYDYVGAQWGLFHGAGGSGELSLRNRRAILQFIESHGGEEYPQLNKDPEDIALVKGLRNIAPSEVSRRFAVTGSGGDEHPFGLSGVLAGMNTSQRTYYIDYCPEIKILYPVLHSAECFGQSPKPLLCFQFLCRSGGLHCEFTPESSLTWTQQTRKGTSYEISLNISSTRHLPD